MSRQEKANFIEELRNALQSYQGFTQSEKNYAHIHLPEWIGAKGELDMFIQKFSERFDLNIKPFLFDKKMYINRA
jgi:hypothetical protein